jgi:hypothetical protein
MGQWGRQGRKLRLRDRVEEVSDVGERGTRPGHTSGAQDDAATGLCLRSGSPQARLADARRPRDYRRHSPAVLPRQCFLACAQLKKPSHQLHGTRISRRLAAMAGRPGGEPNAEDQHRSRGSGIINPAAMRG